MQFQAAERLTLRLCIFPRVATIRIIIEAKNNIGYVF